MTIVDYETLPRPERRTAQKLAEELLRTVPAASEPGVSTSLRGALCTAFMKPENVVAALVYDDGHGNWWGDVVLRTAQGMCQMGTTECHPRHSQQEALDDVKGQIANIKAVREHPLVTRLRANGLNC